MSDAEVTSAANVFARRPVAAAIFAAASSPGPLARAVTRDVGAGFRQRRGHRETQAARAARDERDLTIETKRIENRCVSHRKFLRYRGL